VNRFIEVVKALRRHSTSTVACPQCGSLNISKSTGMDGWMLPPLYLCPNCGYAGRVVLEVRAEDMPRKGAPGGKNDAVQ
jgi:predicted RNA-binding Zn-ribbon protein involved in translation (DUF1610 family)